MMTKKDDNSEETRSDGGTPAGRDIWTLQTGESRESGPIHVIMTALFIGIGIVVGTFGSLAVPIGFVSAFWPGQAVQAAGSIWFGAWGVIAGAVFPVISNTISGSAPLPVSIAYLPGNAVQAGLGALAFKRLNAHPALKTRRDWIIWIVFGVLIANFFGSLWGSGVLLFFDMITIEAWPIVWVGWWVGNSIPSLIFGSILLKFVSPVIIDSKAFVKNWWA